MIFAQKFDKVTAASKCTDKDLQVVLGCHSGAILPPTSNTIVGLEEGIKDVIRLCTTPICVIDERKLFKFTPIIKPSTRTSEFYVNNTKMWTW